jgi:predicted RNA-binding protein associated with RNAse of E/G family
MPKTIRYQYHRLGKPKVVYEQVLVLDRPDVKVLLQESYDGRELTAGDRVILEPGASIIWYVFPDKWHDIGRFHLADGTVTGWYTNLTTPPELNGDTWTARDLFLDLWQPGDGGPAVWLDEDELKEAVRRGQIDRATHQRIENERTMIDLQLRAGEWPPAIARDIGLELARSIAEA